MASFNLDSLTIYARTLEPDEFGVLFRNGNIAAASSVALTTMGAAVVRNGGAISSITSAAIVANGAGLSLENTGTITGGTYGINVVGGGAASNVRIVTSGTINAASDGHAAIAIEGHGAMIVNTGQIVSLGGHGISFSDASPGTNSNAIYNGGHIYARGGGDLAIRGSGAPDDIENAGTISGGVETGLGDDRVVNSGTVTGTIVLGDGNDVFEGRTGEVLGVVFGGHGDDELRAGMAGEELWGQSGQDVLRGGAGSDTLEGGADPDALFGDAGDDFLKGQEGSDTIWGGAGDDQIEGGKAADQINSGSGDDTIIGGRGWDTLRGGRGEDLLDGGDDRDRIKGGQDADTLTGGAGDDVFIMVPGSGADQITDFTDGEDRLNVVAFGLKGFNDMTKTFDLGASSQGVRIDFGGGDVLILDDVSLESLDAEDFMF